MAGSTKEKTDLDAAREDFEAQIVAMRKDIEGLANALKALAETGADAAKTSAAGRLRDAEKAGENALRNAAELAAENRERLTHYTQEKPMMALAIAAGIGLLVGLLTSSRR